nr:uncharacterized protein LOC120964762 [Aegilops tauschii subsp. strangulata]
MLGIPTISSPAYRPSLEETKRFAMPRTRLTPRVSAPAWGNDNPKQEPKDWPQALLFGIACESREQGKKKENAKMDDSALLRPPPPLPFIGRAGKGSYSINRWPWISRDIRAKRTDWDTEKAALLKRVEDAEAALKPVTKELSGLKRQINSMTTAIFGSKSSNLGQDMHVKLKATYTLVEQLYTGAQRAISAISHKKQSPSLIREVLDKLSMLPQRVEELKRSAARAGAITALRRAKAWQAELDPEELATGCPSLKEDESPFEAANFTKCDNDPFWKRQPKDKPPKNTRTKTKAVKKPANKKTVESSDRNNDDLDPASEDDAEASLPARLSPVCKRRSEGTPHSSSGESSATQLPPLKTVSGAKPRPSKKARLNKPVEDNITADPENIPEPKDANVDVLYNDPPPQDHDLVAEHMEVDPSGQPNKPTSPARADDKAASPAKAAPKPSTPEKTSDDKEDDIVITGVGHTTPGNPVALSKHSAKEEISAMGKGKWNIDLSSYTHLNAQDLHSGFLNRLYTSRDYEASLVNMMKERYEAELSKKDSQTTDLQGNIKAQQAETSKARDELTNALAAMEKLKEGFNKEHADWAIEKYALLKRAEDTEAALKPMAEELTGLKRQVNAMTSAIFGTPITHLGSDMRKKLKAAYTLIEQLYTGAQRIICAASRNKPPPTLIQETLERLSMLPARVEELKWSVARAGALTALTQAKAWVPDLDPEDVSRLS